MMDGAQTPRAMPTESHSSPTNAVTIAASSLRCWIHFVAGLTAGRVADGGRSTGRDEGADGVEGAPVMAASTFCLSIPASESGLTNGIVPRPTSFGG